MGVPADHERHRQAERAVLVSDFDPGQVERVGYDLVSVEVLEALEPDQL